MILMVRIRRSSIRQIWRMIRVRVVVVRKHVLNIDINLVNRNYEESAHNNTIANLNTQTRFPRKNNNQPTTEGHTHTHTHIGETGSQASHLHDNRSCRYGSTRQRSLCYCRASSARPQTSLISLPCPFLVRTCMCACLCICVCVCLLGGLSPIPNGVDSHDAVGSNCTPLHNGARLHDCVAQRI